MVEFKVERYGGSQDRVMKNLEVDGVCGTQGRQWMGVTWNNQSGGAWRREALGGNRRTVWEAGLGEWAQNELEKPTG